MNEEFPDEPEMLTGAYVVVPRDVMESLEVERSKDETKHNTYREILHQAQKFDDAGLTSLIAYNTLTGDYIITSRESYEGKLN